MLKKSVGELVMTLREEAGIEPLQSLREKVFIRTFNILVNRQIMHSGCHTIILSTSPHTRKDGSHRHLSRPQDSGLPDLLLPKFFSAEFPQLNASPSHSQLDQKTKSLMSRAHTSYI